MRGGLGDDSYAVDNVGDVVDEAGGGGNDTILAGMSYVLSTDIENLNLTGGGNFDATGNSAVNNLAGNSGNNRLDGGAGADVMAGGLGNDTYYIDDSGDVITEWAGEGNDTVITASDYTVHGNVENLILTGSALSGTGDLQDNQITGNDGNNTLTGLDGNDKLNGGLGADLMRGGQGDDSYWVDNAGDIIDETGAGGNDTILIATSYVLTTDIENISLTGSGDFDATGNDQINKLTGNMGDNRLDGGAGADIMAGGQGDDTYFVDATDETVTELAGDGRDTVIASASFTLTGGAEDLIMTGDAVEGGGNALSNRMTGTAAHNVISGYDGNDLLDGGAGLDRMIGGLGNDTYYVDIISDIVVENAGEGADTVRAATTYVLSANIEKLVLLGTEAFDGFGNDSSNSLTGNDGDNRLYGYGGIDTILAGLGNDVLDGGMGADKLTGGGGNDTYYVDDTRDVVAELAGGGSDMVFSTKAYTLSDFVEKLTLTGGGNTSGTGNSVNNTLIGNDSNNKLSGMAGNDTLGGGFGNDTLDGGKGADNMKGGQGDDRYYVDNKLDIVTEYSNQGTDTVLINGTYTLGAALENLTITGSSDRFGTGNALDNVIIGSSGNNTLGGAGGNDVINGGLGADIMRGGTGDDVFYVDNAADTVTEYGNQGMDTVVSAVSFVLAKNIENLTLQGSQDIDGTGNSLANMLTGNDGVNSLSGGGGDDTLDGGAGADVLSGGYGFDVYYVDNAGDAVIEGVDEGADTVVASTSFTLGANLEDMNLGGSDNINGTGNAGINNLRGNAGDNSLDGGAGDDLVEGGQGNDWLTGGSGTDLFFFFLDSGVDVISDFSAAEGDRIDVGNYHVEATAIVAQVGADATIDLGGGNVITVLNTTATDPAFLAQIIWS